MEKQIRSRDIKLVPIGNSKGVRIPKALLQKYGLNNSLLLEETDRGLLLRKKDDNKLSWEDTYKAMAIENMGNIFLFECLWWCGGRKTPGYPIRKH
jgi:antitoxin MazE